MSLPLFVIMPVRDEAGRHLIEVLDHALKLAPGHVFVYDDRSEDDSPRIAAEMGARVWIRPPDVPSFVEHEGRFRQWGWDAFCHEMRPPSGAWVLAQDADEKLFGTKDLERYLKLPHFDVLGIRFVHMWNKTHYRVDKAWRPTLSTRLFRYVSGGSFADRRLACGSEPDYVQSFVRSGRVRWETPFVMQHLGYQRDEDKAAKYERYSKLDGGEFHAGAHIESILDPAPTLVPWSVP